MGVCRRQGEGAQQHRPTHRRGMTRPAVPRRPARSTSPRSPWQDADLHTDRGIGRLLQRLVNAGVLTAGPRDAVRFFAAAVRAREAGHRPLALLRWIVEGGHWHLITEDQDERGHQAWKAWRLAAEQWDDVPDETVDHAGEADTTPSPNPQSTCGSPASPLLPSPITEQPTDAADTINRWTPDVRALVGQRLLGQARGWTDSESDRRLAARNGWTADRVAQAAASAQQLGVLG